MKVKKADKAEPDTHPDAWQRFERAVDVALHTKPLHKPARPPKRANAKRGLKKRKP